MTRSAGLSMSALLLAISVVACAGTQEKRPAVQVSVTPPARATATASLPPPAPAPPPAAAAPRGAPFGGERWGFVEASSADGRFVVLRRFEGDARPQFGQHGDSATPTHLAVFDTVAGTERAVDEIVDVEPTRRWFLLVEQGHLSLADARSGAFAALGDADMDADPNRCLPPRMGGFSPAGKRVGWMTTAGLRVRDLTSGDEWLVKGKGRVWRGIPEDDTRGATLLEVGAAGADWPRQRTSCACRWCGRFAMSYGVYGWDGPAFDITHVAEDGSRTKSDTPRSKRQWDGESDAGCKVEAKSEDERLARGPWEWKCP